MDKSKDLTIFFMRCSFEMLLVVYALPNSQKENALDGPGRGDRLHEYFEQSFCISQARLLGRAFGFQVLYESSLFMRFLVRERVHDCWSQPGTGREIGEVSGSRLHAAAFDAIRCRLTSRW